MTSTDSTIAEMVMCLNDEVGEHPNMSWDFPRLKIATTFTYSTDANYIAVNMDTAASFGTGAYRSMVPRTLWNRTTRLRVSGPVTDEDWASMIAMGVAPTTDQYRVVGPNLLIYPGHTASNTYGCDYMSKFAVQATGGGSLKEFFTADTDVPLMPSRICLAGLEWRWRQIKGQPYAEEKAKWDRMLEEEANRESIPSDISMDNCSDNKMAAPGLLIAAGSWPLP
jgi:hypothetical protein